MQFHRLTRAQKGLLNTTNKLIWGAAMKLWEVPLSSSTLVDTDKKRDIQLQKLVSRR